MTADLNNEHVKRIDRLAKSAGLSVSERAYILGTAKHETGDFRWLREIWGPTEAQKKYEGRKDLGNTQTGDGKRFLGRGYVQITGRRNYADWARRLGLDLLTDPVKAEAPDVAAIIIVEGMRLGTFTGKKLSDYIGGGRVDYEGARRIVNGTDKAALIAGYARAYERALIAAEQAVKPAKAGWFTALLITLSSLFGVSK